jgi:hypothetical protein
VIPGRCLKMDSCGCPFFVVIHLRKRKIVCMDSVKEIDRLEEEMEAKKEEEFVNLIARIIVHKILNHAREKGYTVPEIQSGQTKLPQY